MPIADRLLSSPLLGKLTTKVWDPLIYSPPVTKLVKKYWYPLGTRLLGDNVPLFMNWAYEEDPADGPAPRSIRRALPSPHPAVPPHRYSGGPRRQAGT